MTVQFPDVVPITAVSSVSRPVPLRVEFIHGGLELPERVVEYSERDELPMGVELGA